MLLLARQHLTFALAVERFYRIMVEAYPPTRRRRLSKAFDRSQNVPPHQWYLQIAQAAWRPLWEILNIKYRGSRAGVPSGPGAAEGSMRQLHKSYNLLARVRFGIKGDSFTTEQRGVSPIAFCKNCEIAAGATFLVEDICACSRLA